MFVIGLTDSGYHLVGQYAQSAAGLDISITGTNVLVTAGANAIVGALGATGLYDGDPIDFEIVPGDGDTNNASFNISGSNLRCNDPLALGVGTYYVRIQAIDSLSSTYSESITIYVVATTRFIAKGPIQSPIGEIIVSPIVGQ